MNEVISVVSLKSVRRAAKACKEATEARKEAEACDAEKRAAMMTVFQSLLGVKSEDEVASLSPDALIKLARKRIRAGLVQLDGIDAEKLLDQVIQKTQSRRSVSWKDAFIAELGASKATELTEAAEESFSYKFAL